jgi:hypothetical protein
MCFSDNKQVDYTSGVCPDIEQTHNFNSKSESSLACLLASRKSLATELNFIVALPVRFRISECHRCDIVQQARARRTLMHDIVM